MIESHFVIVLFDKDDNKVHESLPSNTYPSDDMIAFGLDYKDVAYAKVEKRYTKITAE